MADKQKPVHTVRHGNVKAAIWENAGKSGAFYRVSFTRSYKDGDAWKDTTSYGLFDIWDLVHCAGEAYVWISRKLRAQSSDAQDEAAA